MSLSITLEVGTESVTRTINFTVARGRRFLDDLIEHFENIQDGVDEDDKPIMRPMDRIEVGAHYIEQLLKGQVAWSKGLEQRRLDTGRPIATDLEQN